MDTQRAWFVLRYLSGSIYRVEVVYSSRKPWGDEVIWICSKKSAYALLLFVRKEYAKRSRRNSSYFLY